MLETLKEGKRFKIHSLMAGENRYLFVCARYSYFLTKFNLIDRTCLFRNTFGFIFRGRQASCKTSLTMTRSTRYQEIDVDDNFLDLIYEPREVR